MSERSASSKDAADVIESMRAAVLSPTGRISVSPAFGMQGTYWGVQVYDGRTKVGPYLVASEDEDQTPAGALRSLARLVDNATSDEAGDRDV